MPKLKPELQRVYYSRWLEAIAFSLIGVFLPIFLLENGFPLFDVILFYTIIHITLGLFAPISAIIIEKIGYKHTAFPHPVFAIVFFLALPILPENPWLLQPLAAVKGIMASLYWISINSLFIQHSTKGRRASEQSINTAAVILISVLAPLVGGLIIVFFGFNVLFYLAAAIMIFSLIPLFSTPDYKPKEHFKLKDTLGLYNFKFHLSYIGEGARFAAGGILLPLLFYFILKDPLFVGGFKSLMSLLDLGIVLIAGKFADSHDDRKIIKRLAPVVALLTAGFYFTNNIFMLAILTILLAVTGPFLSMGFVATFFDQSAKKPLTNMVSREMYLLIGRLAVLIPVLYFVEHYEIGFLISAVGTLFYLFV
ncbi:MAG: MFS transporter [Candidatus Diapherotrites archaeon]|nr:MFS transporter [Candidatus Diapherotrites archaeon]